MKITVNEQPQQFYLASSKWIPAVGHEIKVGKYQFCAIPLFSQINVSEVTTGAKVTSYPINFIVDMMTESKEGSMDLFYMIGEKLKQVIETRKHFDDELAKMKQTAFDRLGEMPPIENVDVEEIVKKG